MAEGEQQQPHDQPQTNWAYHPETAGTPPAPGAPDPTNAIQQPSAEVEWTASEFIAHKKTALWYLTLGISTVVIDALMYLAIHDLIPPLAFTVMIILLGVAAGARPRLVTYRLERGGLMTGRRFHPYGKFKSFAIVDEGAFSSILLVPIRRFDFPVNVYFPPDNEKAIVEALSRHLPLQPGEPGILELLTRYVRF